MGGKNKKVTNNKTGSKPIVDENNTVKKADTTKEEEMNRIMS
jgi:hypothetical protein